MTNPYGMQALTGELAKLARATEGDRNNTLNQVWLKVCHHINAGNLDRDEAWQRVYDVARRIGLGEAEIRATMASAENGARENPRDRQPVSFDGLKRAGGGAVPTPPVDSATSSEFWTARPSLALLHQFARARLVSPWALLGVELVRVAAAVRPFVVLPAITGSYASLNTYIALVGPSGVGKDAAIAAADDALDVGPVVKVGVGSGEGIAHQFARYVKPNSEKGIAGGLEIQTASVIFEAAEVETLTALKQRNASTLWPEFRKAWTGAALGFAYVAPEKRLRLPAHSYRLGLIVGVQPERAGPLLGDDDAGTPQRFLWLPAIDSAAPDLTPDQPTPMQWRPSAWPTAQPNGRVALAVCPVAVETIRAARLARLRGDGHALDGHALLARLKAAALLDILDGHQEITEDGWQLAGTLMAVSDATRAGVAQVLASQAARANRERGEAEGERAAIVSGKVENAAVKRVANTIWRKLGTDWTSHSDLRNMVAARDRRDHFEPALDRLAEAGLIEVEQQGNWARYRRAERAAR